MKHTQTSMVVDERGHLVSSNTKISLDKSISLLIEVSERFSNVSGIIHNNRELLIRYVIHNKWSKLSKWLGQDVVEYILLKVL